MTLRPTEILGTLLLSTAITLSGCRTTISRSKIDGVSPGSGALRTVSVDIKDSEADHFRQALTDAGVQIELDAMGLQRLAAQSLTCHDDHTSVSAQECVLSTATGDLGVTGPEASVLFKVLKTHADAKGHTVVATNLSCQWSAKATVTSTTCQFNL